MTGRSYGLGNPELDALVAELIERAAENGDTDLITEMVVTALKLHRDRAERGDLRLINAALKEMRYSALVFSRHDEPKVTMFGSARTPPDHPNYRLAVEFASKMVDRGWGVVTGAGPGIMEAGNLGAGPDATYGVNIRLPFEANANQHLRPDRTVNFKYFFTRKLGFVKESQAFALFPGGFGTLDETFELLTLVQTGKSDLHPIVLLEAPGTGYWERLVAFIQETLVGDGMVSPDDMSLFRISSDADDAVEEICHFYANYHSQRYVDGALVLRLLEVPADEVLAELSDEFGDIIVEGGIERIEPTPQEVRDADALDYDRIRLLFDRRHYGRLRELVDRLNNLVVTPREVHPPAPFGTEQADREW